MAQLLRVLICTVVISLGLAQTFGRDFPIREHLGFGRQIEAVSAVRNNSLSVRGCPGYQLESLKESSTGLTAKLVLAGAACNAFGQDVSDLTIKVTYESESRLHVNIFDSSSKQYTIPQSVVELPSAPTKSFTRNSDLVFNYEPSPFAFWITRRSWQLESEEPLFDTRLESLRNAPVPPVTQDDKSTAHEGFPLIFEDQYLQLASALPIDANIYGLGEVVAKSGFRRNITSTVQTMWARDVGDPIDENIYGGHPIYLEHRYNSDTKTSQSHGVFLHSAAGGDILLRTPPSAKRSLIEYRMIGGTLDFYFFSGPTPNAVIEQYGTLVGLPTWQPAWGFGFHLCRWGYKNLAETREQVTKMREANIPLEVMWNDIDLYHAVRDFTTDPVSYPGDEVRTFIRELAANNQHFIPIVDAAIPKQINKTDIYHPYTNGVENDVFIKNPDGSEYVGQVWPGYTVFPDWFAKNTQNWWTNSLRNWSQHGVEFSGIWVDMNEASSFCDGSCGSTADLSNTSAPFILPGEPGNLVNDWPECYDSSFGNSGNITVNGTLTCQPSVSATLIRRGVGEDIGTTTDIDLNEPPYAIHNGFGRLSNHALATNATHAGGEVELDVHNLWGMMSEKATHLSLLELFPNKRPFIIGRSTFPSAGRWTGHWLGDNYSLWSYLKYSIQGVLQFQLFQIPFVGADACGFIGNSNEELCNRWMQLAAFTPFYRNHNIRGAIGQEPYRWDSVAEASRAAIAIRYSLLPYWYTLFANSSRFGTPPIRALFFEYPDEPELFGVDSQFLIGTDILVTPVLEPNVTSVSGYFPGGGKVTWRDWYTHKPVTFTPGEPASLSAPLGHINVHIRDGSAILLHAKPGYTIEETRQGPYSLLVSLDARGNAQGSAYIDDGISYPPGPSREIRFSATKGGLKIKSEGKYHVEQRLEDITVLGVGNGVRESHVRVDGKKVEVTFDEAIGKLVLSGLNVDLNQPLTISWN